MPLNLGLRYNTQEDTDTKVRENVSKVRKSIKDKIDATYKRIPKPVRFILPKSERSVVRLTNMAEKAKKSSFVPSIVTRGLYNTAVATALKNTYKRTRTRGGKKSKKQNSYTKKEKKKINGVTKVIYTKKNSKKLYVKSKGRMMNLKRYKKISKKR
tara:strand:+ start:87 stop:554 length:468 start_codon:yes stop_codon:yes gene_type:complete